MYFCIIHTNRFMTIPFTFFVSYRYINKSYCCKISVISFRSDKDSIERSQSH